jgi:4-hydroxybenzoate polyprenyltransferase
VATNVGLEGFGKSGGAAPGGVRRKTIALPNEHGGWGLSLEPVVLGLVVAPSLAGLGLAVTTVAAFLTRHPLKIAAGDRRRGRRFPRTPVAERFALLYGSVALAGFLLACAAAPSWDFLLPLALAAPFAAVQLAYDLKGQSRSLWPELSGSAAMASVAAGSAVAGGWGLVPALGLWAVLAARVAPTILFVRARLKQLHGKEASAAPVHLAHAAAFALVLALAAARIVTWLAPAALLVLALRALHGFNERGPVTAKRVGVRELIYGALTVAAVAAGHYLDV